MKQEYFLHNVSELARRRSEKSGKLWVAVAIVLGVVVLAFLFSGASEARDYAWCIPRDSYVQCDYATREQCVAAASGIGGSCRQNPQILLRSSPRNANANAKSR
jgi:hypothetical protein